MDKRFDQAEEKTIQIQAVVNQMAEQLRLFVDKGVKENYSKPDQVRAVAPASCVLHKAVVPARGDRGGGLPGNRGQ